MPGRQRVLFALIVTSLHEAIGMDFMVYSFLIRTRDCRKPQIQKWLHDSADLAGTQMSLSGFFPRFFEDLPPSLREGE